MATKNILVTGGTGFIGYNLANSLSEKGHKVTVVDIALNNLPYLRKGVNFILADIRKISFDKTYDVVYHMAALRSLPDSFVYPEEYISTNVWGTYNIVRSFPDSRIVFASSSAAAESKCVYGASKRSAEHFINMHKNAVSVRFMNVFGERQHDLQMAFPAFCHCIKYDKKAVVNGTGMLARDYTYVDDLVDELIRIGDSKMKGQTEIGYGQPIKILYLYQLLCKTAKKKENVKFGPPRRGDMKFTCSKYKIKEPRYGFMEGLRRTLKYYLTEESF